MVWVVWLFALPLAMLFSPVLLRAAIALLNKIVACYHSTGNLSEHPFVPTASFSKAIETSVLLLFVNGVICTVVGYGTLVLLDSIRFVEVARVVHGVLEGPSVNLVSVPILLIVDAGLLAWILPTNFGRALLLMLLYMIIACAVVFLLTVVLFGVFSLCRD